MSVKIKIMYNLLQNKYDLHAQYFTDGKITLNHFLEFESYFTKNYNLFTICLN